jgi:hypothetical protein
MDQLLVGSLEKGYQSSETKTIFCLGTQFFLQHTRDKMIWIESMPEESKNVAHDGY